MYKRAAIIFIFFFFRRSLLRNKMYNKSQLSLLAASSKFQKNFKRIVFSVIFYSSENLLSALSPEFLFAFDWFMFLSWSCFGFVFNIFRIFFPLLWMEIMIGLLWKGENFADDWIVIGGVWKWTKIPLYLAQPAHISGAHASASMTPTESDIDEPVLLIKII